MVVGFLLTLSAPATPQFFEEDLNDPRVFGHVWVTARKIGLLAAQVTH